MKRDVDYTWRLAKVMARAGMHNSTDLAPLLRERGIDLSASQAYRVVTQRPERVSLKLLAALTDIFSCGIEDLVTFTATATATDAGRRPGNCARCTLRSDLTLLLRPHEPPQEQFARWHHLTHIRAKSVSGHSTQGPVHNAKQEITEALRFLDFLAQRGMSLGICSQADLDTWLSTGPTTRHTIRTFMPWAVTNHHATALTMVHRQAASTRLLSQDERLTWLRRCLVQDGDTLAYRVAGVLLLYAQPLVRIAALRTQDVETAPQGLFLRLGGDPVPLPEPFATLMRAHLADRPNMRTTNTAGSPWLFPGTRAGRHLHPNTLTHRLRTLGINPLGARNAALRELVQQAPAPLVADLLGYSTQITLAHANRAAQPYNRYPHHAGSTRTGT